jgi:hypothetical protein
VITEKSWIFATRDWVAGRILHCIKSTDRPTTETHIYAVCMSYHSRDENNYPSWATIGRAGRKKFIETAMRALLRRGQVIIVGHTKDYRAEGGSSRLYELGTVLDRLAAAPELPLVGSDQDESE